MYVSTIRKLRAAAVLVGWLALSAAAQTVPTAPKRQSPSNYPPALGPREGPAPPALTFRRVSATPLPGPLGAEATRLEDGTVRLPVDGGWAIVSFEPDVAVRITDNDPAATLDAERIASPWVVSPDGRLRFTSQPAGVVLAERHRRKGWKRKWRLSVAAATPSPPVLAGARLFFGALDNQVHAVRSENGHLLWTADAGARLSHPLTLWRLALELEPGSGETSPLELVLAVPDDGASLIALDSFDGSRVATLELPGEDRRFLPPAMTTGDGRIVVAIQEYDPSAASLVVFELAPPEQKPPAAGVAYNGPERPGDGSSD